jgi:hypothetical protein
MQTNRQAFLLYVHLWSFGVENNNNLKWMFVSETILYCDRQELVLQVRCS